MGVPADTVDVIGSGVDWALYQMKTEDQHNILRSRFGVRDHEIVVIVVGRLHPMKGFDFLLEAVAKVPLDMGIKIVGDGPLKDHVEERAKKIPNVHLISGIPHGRIVEYFRIADIFVLPSIDLPGQSEGTPLALIETMAAGLPVVVSDSGGSHKHVADGVYGYVVPQANPVALEDAIQRLVADQESRNSMGMCNRQSTQHKDWGIIAKRVEETYDRSLATYKTGV